MSLCGLLLIEFISSSYILKSKSKLQLVHARYNAQVVAVSMTLISTPHTPVGLIHNTAWGCGLVHYTLSQNLTIHPTSCPSPAEIT